MMTALDILNKSKAFQNAIGIWKRVHVACEQGAGLDNKEKKASGLWLLVGERQGAAFHPHHHPPFPLK